MAHDIYILIYANIDIGCSWSRCVDAFVSIISGLTSVIVSALFSER